MNIDFTNVPKHYAARTHEAMQDVVLHKGAPGPAVHYYMIRGGKDQKNITVWEPGLVGDEYIKTYGHYHVGDLDETYSIIFGEGVALLQKLALDVAGQPIADVVQDFKAIKVKAGDSVYMPPGFGHLVVNIGVTYFVTADDSPVHFDDSDPTSWPGHADYELVKRMRGFAFYVVERNSAPALVKNPLYKEVRAADFGGLAVIQ